MVVTYFSLKLHFIIFNYTYFITFNKIYFIYIKCTLLATSPSEGTNLLWHEKEGSKTSSIFYLQVYYSV